ncbi:MAG: VWA domain-containing protein [Bacteroidales bacterium]|jgi:Ca-activated chloride channel family protein
MIQIAQAQYLWILALIPLLFLAYGMYRRHGKRMLKKFGDPELMKPLMPDVSPRKGWLKMVLFSLGLFFFVLGLSRPRTGARVKEMKRTGVEIIIAMDVSNSMLAEDYSPNRLERAKLAVSRLVDNLGRDRIGLIIFAGDAFVQLPVTTDYVSAKMFLRSISTHSIPRQGTAIGQAILTGIRSFSLDTPGSRALIIISDGEDHEDDPVPIAKEAAQQGVQVHCIGIGSETGKPIPMDDGSLLKDKEGNIVVTKLDEKTLMEVAEAGKGVYVRAGHSDFGLQGIFEQIRKMDEQEFQSVVFEDFNEQYMYFFGIALFFFLMEMLIGERKVKRFKSFDIFTRTFLFFLVFTGISIAATAQPDKKDVRAGNKAFRRGDLEQALIDYQKALSKDTTSLKAKYNLANVLHQLEQHDQAVETMHAVPDSLQINEQKADAWHNSGNFQLSREDYAKSIEAYKNALRKRPGDYETKTNLAYAQKMLRDQQDKENQDEDKNQEQDQDQDQDQEKDQDREQDKNKNQEQPEPAITPQAAQQILEAIQQKEKETQEKIQKEKAKAAVPVRSDKNW